MAKSFLQVACYQGSVMKYFSQPSEKHSKKKKNHMTASLHSTPGFKSNLHTRQLRNKNPIKQNQYI